jgi:hypothetical protein
MNEDVPKNGIISIVGPEGDSLLRAACLPVLGNEETLADSFATHYIVSKMPADRALRILKARVESVMFEASEVPRKASGLDDPTSK